MAVAGGAAAAGEAPARPKETRSASGKRLSITGLIPLTYGPDTLTNYEAGLKSEWLENRLQLNVSLFYMEWEDIQINDRADD